MRTLTMLAIGALVLGCGTDAPKPAAPVASFEVDEGCGEALTPVGEGGTFTPDQGTATVKGVVRFEGDPPPRRALDVGSEAFCVQLYKDEPLRSEKVIVGANGALANVLVRVTAGHESWKFDATGEVVLDQKACRYVPHVLAAQVGQTLRVRNSDPIMHNVHGVNAKTGKDEFNWAQAKQGIESTKELKKAGLIQVKCDVHGWMVAYVMVEKHPFCAVTGEDGTFELPKLPPGSYTVEAWHEELGTRTAQVAVGDGETKEISFAFAAK